MSKRAACAVTTAALALVVGITPATGGGERSTAGLNVVSVTPTTGTTRLSTTKINTVTVTRDLRFKVVIRNLARARRDVRVTLAVAQPQPSPASVVVRAFGAQEAEAVTMRIPNPIALGQALRVTITVRAASGAPVRRSYRVIFTIR